MGREKIISWLVMGIFEEKMAYFKALFALVLDEKRLFHSYLWGCLGKEKSIL